MINMRAKPILVAMELLQLHDLNARLQAAAEKQEAIAVDTQEAAPRPRQLKPRPIVVKVRKKGVKQNT